MHIFSFCRCFHIRIKQKNVSYFSSTIWFFWRLSEPCLVLVNTKFEQYSMLYLLRFVRGIILSVNIHFISEELILRLVLLGYALNDFVLLVYRKNFGNFLYFSLNKLFFGFFSIFRCVELIALNSKEKSDWIDTIWYTVNECLSRRNSFSPSLSVRFNLIL